MQTSRYYHRDAIPLNGEVSAIANSFKQLKFLLEQRMMPVEYVDITNAEDAGQRIDNFLLRSLKGLPRQRIYKIAPMRCGLTVVG